MNMHNMEMQGRPDHPQRPLVLRGLPDDPERQAPAGVEVGRRRGDGAAPRGARRVPLLLVPPGAAPPLPLLALPLAPPLIHRHRANHL